MKIKEAETAYKLQLEAIKTDFDAGDEVKRKKVETAIVNLEKLEKAHREPLENLEKLQTQMAGKQQAEEVEDLYGEQEPAFDGCGAIVDPFSLQCQVQTELAQLAPTVPETEVKMGESPELNPFFGGLVEKATASLVSKNMAAEIAKALEAQKRVYDSICDHKMNELQQQGRYIEMDLTEPAVAEKRKPTEQLEPEGGTENLSVVAPVTPLGPRPPSQASSGGAGSASGTVRVNPY